MAIMIVRFLEDGRGRFGRLLSAPPAAPDDQIEIAEFPAELDTTASLIAALADQPKLAERGQSRRLSARALASPVTADGALVCQGLNYRDHAAEAGHHARKANLFFAKSSSSLCGPYDDILRPAGVELLDYEVEIGVVLRRAVTRETVVDAANVGRFVAGVVLCNDVSARDTMFGASFLQWFQGKSYRTFCPTGPVLYLMDPHEVADILEGLQITLAWNGEVKQSAVSADLIYKPAETLSQLAEIMDLAAGDMVLTGTPGGVIAQGTPKLIEILKTQLLNDVQRRDDMRLEMTSTQGRFLEPGDTLALTLSIPAAKSALGGQLSRIAESSKTVGG